VRVCVRALRARSCVCMMSVYACMRECVVVSVRGVIIIIIMDISMALDP